MSGDYPPSYFSRWFRHEARCSQRNRQRVQSILKYRREGLLLEIGCGMGGFLAAARPFFHVEGIDLSPYAAAQAQARLPGVTIRQANIENAALPSEVYDAVCLYNVLEHLSQPEGAARKVFDSLKPGGIMAGSVPNNFSLVGGTVTRLSNLFDRTHVSTLSPETWCRIFARAGFNRVNFFGELLLGPNLSWYVRGRLWPSVSFNLMFLCEKR
jgi:SAM-dependent methyltransferase